MKHKKQRCRALITILLLVVMIAPINAKAYGYPVKGDFRLSPSIVRVGESIKFEFFLAYYIDDTGTYAPIRHGEEYNLYLNGNNGVSKTLSGSLSGTSLWRNIEYTPDTPGVYTVYIMSRSNLDSDYPFSYTSESLTFTVQCKEHTIVTDPAVPATCTKTGLTEGSHCSVCGEVIEEQQETPVLGHDYVGVYTPPAGTTPGYTTYTCSRCGDSYRVNNTGSTLITYTKEAEYTVTIPDSFTLGNTAEEKQILATGMLERDQNLTVSISSKQYSSGWQMRSENNDVLPYSIRIGQQDLVNHADVLSATALQLNSGSTSTLSFSVKNPPAYAGTYTDTLTFTVSVNANE